MGVLYFDHAYIEPRKDQLKIDDFNGERPWWMFSQERDGILTVTFCDLGVGIPDTLPKTRPSAYHKLVQKLTSKPKDAEVIDAAITDSRTRTGKQHRGKGLKQIADTVTNVTGGRIIIHSNRGVYSRSEKNNEKPYMKNFKDSIYGTMIFWQLPI